MVDTALLFPPLDRGEGAPEVPAHQAFLHDVIEGLKREDSPVSSLFATNVGVLLVAPFSSTVGNARCNGMDCLARWRHGRALNGPLA